MKVGPVRELRPEEELLYITRVGIYFWATKLAIMKQVVINFI